MTVVCHCCLRYEIKNTHALSCCGFRNCYGMGMLFCLVFMFWNVGFICGVWWYVLCFVDVSFMCLLFLCLSVCWCCMSCVLDIKCRFRCMIFQLWSLRSFLILSLPCFAEWCSQDVWQWSRCLANLPRSVRNHRGGHGLFQRMAGCLLLCGVCFWCCSLFLAGC